ncbi:MAG: hypothetical protein AAE983_06820 [Thermoplasmataceae archaeon]|jgi:hypothetical protein
MAKDDGLASAVESCRKVSDDGKLVTYDLTGNIDFSKPKEVAKALTEVFFQKDASRWFKVSGENVDFSPDFKVRIVITEENSRQLKDTVDDFLKDIQKDGLKKSFSPEIGEEADHSQKIGGAMAAGALKGAIYKHGEEKILKNYIRDDLFVDILECLEIRSLNNEDLINWKKLPL